MGFGPTGSDIAQTLTAVSDRLSNILVENRKLKSRQQELEAAAKTQERAFRIKERELAIKFMEQQMGAGQPGAEAKPGTPLDVIRAANAEKFVIEDFERDFVNNNGGIDWVDMDSRDIKRSLASLRSQIDSLAQEKLKITSLGREGVFNARIQELQKRFDEGRDLLTRMAKAREEDPSLQSRLSAVRGLLGSQARKAFEDNAQPQSTQAPPATPQAATIPTDRAADRPQNVEIDGPAVDVRDVTLEKFRSDAAPIEVKRGLRQLFQGRTTEEVNAIGSQLIRDVLSKDGPDKARELFQILKTYKKD